jgi:hypothetical protein
MPQTRSISDRATTARLRDGFMLYTSTSPAEQTDRIRLYPTPLAARGEIGDGPALFAVAVRLGARWHHLVPLWTDAGSFDPTWTTPAELHADGSITAKGPIPDSLFAACLSRDEAPRGRFLARRTSSMTR